jgi:hypothetical protein
MATGKPVNRQGHTPLYVTKCCSPEGMPAQVVIHRFPDGIPPIPLRLLYNVASFTKMLCIMKP